MVMTSSNMMPLGTSAPDFTLRDAISDKMLCLNDVKSELATVIMFICNHCPFVKYIDSELAKYAKMYQRKNISFVAINANDAEEYPEDAPDKMKQHGQNYYSFPYLYDETQAVAKAYRAACTPDFYIFDAHLKCVYRGQFDAARPNNDIPITGKDMRDALDCLIAGKPVNAEQKPSMGCNIKWKA